jgi:hypothetical protein
VRTLREIVDDYERVNAEAKEYFDAVLRPRIDACRSRVEFRELLAWTKGEACSEDGRSRDVPDPIAAGMIRANEVMRDLPEIPDTPEREERP